MTVDATRGGPGVADESVGERGAERIRRPRLGFAGVGWIGRHRLETIARAGAAEIVAIADPSDEMLAGSAEVVPQAVRHTDFGALLGAGLDGIVIATPSALHAGQALAALESGSAVFCQKPLGRTAAETASVVAAAERADRLLGVDFSYRYAKAFRAAREAVVAGEIGRLFSGDLVFHNAYGPDKSWFRDRALSGGGCVMDLGIHLVDMALWVAEGRAVVEVTSELFGAGDRLRPGDPRVEEYATATLRFEDGATMRLGCSWNLSVGRDAIISATFYGPGGGVGVENIDGSFFDFRADRFLGTHREGLVEPPDDWGGGAILDWVERLGQGEGFDPGSFELVRVAEVIDAIYAASGR